jgi:hypothetical protein
MSDDRWASAVAEVKRRVEEGRRDGTYPEELDVELASQFARAGKDPLAFSSLPVLRERIDALGATRMDLTIDPASSVPGGSGIHQLVSKLITRQVQSIARQLSAVVRSTTAALEGVADSLDELRTVVANDVLGDIDSLHHRLIVLEHQVARMETEPELSEPT